jgi:hypothetical protein
VSTKLSEIVAEFPVPSGVGNVTGNTVQATCRAPGVPPLTFETVMSGFVHEAPYSPEFGHNRRYAVCIEAERLFVKATDSVPVSLCVDESHVRFSV